MHQLEQLIGGWAANCSELCTVALFACMNHETHHTAAAGIWDGLIPDENRCLDSPVLTHVMNPVSEGPLMLIEEVKHPLAVLEVKGFLVENKMASLTMAVVLSTQLS